MQKVNILDVLNANLTYTTSLLKEETLNTEKNKFLLLTSLTYLTAAKFGIQKLKEFYPADNSIEALKNFIEDKAELLKQLNLYKQEDYFN